MITDSHVHFDSFDAAGDVAPMLGRAAEAGVTRCVAIGGNPSANQVAVRVAKENPSRVRAVVGFDRDQVRESPSRDELASLAAEDVVVGIGETGLDYHYEPGTALEQQALLREMLALGRARKLPVVLHNRDSDGDMMKILREHAAAWSGAPDRIGVLHCYTGGIPMAEQLLALGFHISFSGIVTFRNAESLRQVAMMVPSDRILVETDSPYLAPVPLRGKSNEPAFVKHVVELLAKMRSVSADELASQTSRNASRLFAWD
jgi:TatD DNase family protein